MGMDVKGRAKFPHKEIILGFILLISEWDLKVLFFYFIRVNAQNFFVYCKFLSTFFIPASKFPLNELVNRSLVRKLIFLTMSMSYILLLVSQDLA